MCNLAIRYPHVMPCAVWAKFKESDVRSIRTLSTPRHGVTTLIHSPAPPHDNPQSTKMDTLAGLARWQQVAHTADNGLDALAELDARRCNCMLGDVCMCACADGERVPRARPSPARVLVAPGPRRDRDDETEDGSVLQRNQATIHDRNDAALGLCRVLSGRGVSGECIPQANSQRAGYAQAGAAGAKGGWGPSKWLTRCHTSSSVWPFCPLAPLCPPTPFGSPEPAHRKHPRPESLP